MKGIILCAGKGSRLSPFTNDFPKAMLSVANKPMLYYLINKLTESGITDIAIIINKTQHQIVDYVANNKHDASITLLYQDRALGIAHALLIAEEFVGSDKFILLLGDNLITENIETLSKSYMDSSSDASLLLYQVENPIEYGVAEVSGDFILGVEEKPQNPKSDLAIAGIYLFDPRIFKAARNIVPSARGEYEITDAIQWMLNRGYKLSFAVTKLPYIDVGTPARWLQANKHILSSTLSTRISVGNNSEIENCTFTGPVLIGANVKLSNTEIGPYVSIGNNSRIRKSKIMSSICLENSDLYCVNINDQLVGPQTLLDFNC